MRNAAGHCPSHQISEGFSGIINIINRFRNLEDSIDRGNVILDQALNTMSPYSLSESEKQLARFGDRVSIIVGLAVGGKIDEKEAFNEIKLMYKDLKALYKASRIEDHS